MVGQFDFLKNAKASTLFNLLEKLPSGDAAVVVAGLPHTLGVQVLAYFPERRHAELLLELRQARRADPAKSAEVAGRIMRLLLDARQTAQAIPSARPINNPDADPPAPPKPAAGRGADPAVNIGRMFPLGRKSPYEQVAPSPSGAKLAENRQPPRLGKPSPWLPRSAESSPINGPALPNKPPPVAGNPLESPLAKSGLLELISRAREKFLPRDSLSAKPGQLAIGGKAPPRIKPAGASPEPKEGLASSGSVKLGGIPRVIGPAQSRREKTAETRAPEARARRMDGKAILAAILRQADAGVRANVRREDPLLYRDLRGKMFYFDDLMLTGDSSLAMIFTVAPIDVSALALRFASPALRERVLRAVSPGRARALRDAPAKRNGLDSVEAAQEKVLSVALQLQAAGRILIDPNEPDLA